MKTATVAEDILGFDDLVVEAVEVPEWRTVVYVRALTGEQRDAFEESIIEIKGEGKKQTRKLVMANCRAKLLVRSITNEKGEPLFDEGHVAALGRKSGKALDRLFDVSRRLAGISDGDVEEMVGKSEPAPNGSST